MENKFVRCKEDDPNRCQGVTKEGQCPYLAMPPSKYCAMHGGIKGQDSQKSNKLANYRLEQYQERVGDLANSPEIKSLREEIGILRMTLESMLNLCKNANMLLTYTDKITNIVGQLQKLIEASQRMEERNNNLLDRKVVIVIADSIVTLLGQYINDPDQLTEIGDKICESITVAASPANPLGVATESNNGSLKVGI